MISFFVIALVAGLVSDHGSAPELPREGDQQSAAVATISACASDDCVGHVVKTLGSPIIQKYDGDVDASYGDVGFGTWKMRAYAVWELSAMPPGAVITRVRIRTYIWPPSDSDHTTEYRRLTCDPRSTGGGALWTCLQGVQYTWFSTGTSDGYRTTTLGGSAIADLQGALASGWFAVAITEAGDSDGEAKIAGWTQGMPQLLVDYMPASPVDPTSWGRMKAMYR